MSSSLRVQVVIHAGSRLASGLLSFYLFGLISRLYEPALVKHIYFFLFVFGFAAAALRTLGNVSAGLDPNRTRTHNLRRLQTALGEVVIACVFVVPFAVWSLAEHVQAVGLLVAATVTLSLSAVDVDMFRGMLRKDPRFSVAFALGSGMAVCLLLGQDHHSLESAIAALLLQWLPVCLSNVGLIFRLLRKSLRRALRRLRTDFSILLVLTVVALFDGLVLNLPFFLGSRISLDTSLQIAVVIRLFSASLVFFPLVLHWSNSDYLRKVARRFSVRPPVAYLVLQVLAAALFGSAFAAAFHLVAQRPVSLWQMFAFYVLASSYCVYATLARFGASRQSTPRLAWALAATVAALWGGVVLLLHWSELSSLPLVALQALTLLLGSLLIRRFTSHSSGPARRGL